MGRTFAVLLSAALVLSACLAGNGRGRESSTPPTWSERWKAVYGPGDKADRACHDLMVALLGAVKAHDRERIFRRLHAHLTTLSKAREDAEALVLLARKESGPIDDTINWEEIAAAWVGTELHVRKLIPVEILEKARKE